MFTRSAGTLDVTQVMSSVNGQKEPLRGWFPVGDRLLSPALLLLVL
ncbi:MAG: hypothetical protein V4671_32320 [Armatimonadota bacterium]